MKKILSSILAASVFTASLAVPVFADYVAPDDSYDVIQFDYTYDDGTEINAIDNSQAKKITDEERIMALDDTTIMAKEYFMSFDFRYDSAEDGSIPGKIQIDKAKSSGAADKIGPGLTIRDGELSNQYGSSNYQSLGAVEPDTWYTLELEGKMAVADAVTTVRLYSYEDGQKILIQQTDALELRQMATGTNGTVNAVRANNVTIDNFKLISENPDKIEISATNETIDAGQISVMDYATYRMDVPVTKHDVTWSVYNEDNSEEITDGSVSIDDSGVLKADIGADSQTVTVRATATFGEKELIGTKQIVIRAVNTDDEKFDSIYVEGPESVKAGTETEYTITAMKSGENVTDTLEDGDVIWSIYDYANIKEIYSGDAEVMKISVENGVLKIANGVTPQTITVRASSQSGIVYGSATVNIAFSDSQTEEVIYSNTFDSLDTGVSGENEIVSIDGSSAYMTTSYESIWAVSNYAEYTLTELDIKFANEGAGFTLKRRDGGKTNTSVTYSGGSLTTHSGVLLQNADTDTWYHIELLYSSENADASCNIYKYNENGVLDENSKVTCQGIDMRNGSEYGNLEIATGTAIDNVKISLPEADNVKIIASAQYMFAGTTSQFSATATRNDLSLKNYSGIVWTVLDSENLPIIDGSVTVNEQGLVTVDAMAKPQTVVIKAETANGGYDTFELTIQTSEMFTVKNIGVNEDGNTIVRLYVDKNFYYNDDVSFIIAVKDSNGVLKGLEIMNTFGDRLSIGSNELSIDFELPAGFDPETHKIETMVWTTL